MLQNGKRLAMTTLMFLFFSAPVFAQEGAAKSGSGFSDNWLSGVGLAIGMALAAGLAALGDSRAIAAACEGVARNPGAGARIQTVMLIGVVFIETLVLFTFALLYLKIPAFPGPKI